MVSECANPGCRTPFLYFREGRLFAVPRKNSASTEYFWLCGSCAEEVELQFGNRDDQDHEHSPTVVVREGRQTHRHRRRPRYL